LRSRPRKVKLSTRLAVPSRSGRFGIGRQMRSLTDRVAFGDGWNAKSSILVANVLRSLGTWAAESVEHRMKIGLPVLRAFWSLLWRSVALLPVAFLFLIILVALWVAIVMLPIVGVYFLLQAEWLRAAVVLLIWTPLLFLARWRLFKVDSKDILNERENV
jgi:hypothetical protein